MSQPFPSPCRLVRPSDLRGRPGVLRRLLAVPVLGLLIAAGLMLAPALASADTSSTLTAVGTSDVSDSGLMQDVIQPEFHAAYPQFTFKYIGTATGEAITDVETGSEGASILIVHAASIENQFVADGYSYLPYGLAIFRNDFVFAGPAGDPAGVSGNAANNIVQAFADVATAGYNGGGTPKATFIARDSGSGTSVEEHGIWTLVGQMASPPPGLTLCAVPAAIGGGETPVKPGVVAASGDPCPAGGNDGLPPATDFPSWYIGTTIGQGPTVLAANACAGYASAAGTCYVLTDRGTFDYLSSGLDPAGSIPGLTILTRDNSATAPGGTYKLINYFHAYIVNPAKTVAGGTTKEPVNLAAAKDFVNFLTSPAFQSQLKYYLDGSPPDNDLGGPPFVADASPIITEKGIPHNNGVGKRLTVTGSVTNAEVGYPVLAGKTVAIDEIEAGLPVAVASAKTNAAGHYRIRFVPTSSGLYQVSTGQITQIENKTLSPVYGDILSPAASTAVQLTVRGLGTSTSVTFQKVTVKNGALKVTGTLKPPTIGKGTRIELLAVRAGVVSKEVGHASLGTGKTKFTIKAKLARGFQWVLQLEYVQKGHTSVYSKLRSIAVH
jgi:ABC-type tungstate transport system permease subunit